MLVPRRATATKHNMKHTTIYQLAFALTKLRKNVTFPETSIAHENRLSQKESNLPAIQFQVL